MSSDQPELGTILAAESLRLFPPFIRQALLEDAGFRDRHGIYTDATITFGSSGLSFKRSIFFSAVRAALGGAADTALTAPDGTKWRVGAEDRDGGRIVALKQDKRKVFLPGLLILSPNREERLSELDRDAAAAGLDDSTISEWRARVADAPVADEDVESIRSELRNSPLRVASAITEELESGETSVAALAPREPHYYERLVGAWCGQRTLSEFVSTTGAEHIRKLIARNATQGLKLALLMSAHQSFSEVIAGEPLPLSVLSEVFEQLTKTGDRFSQVGAIEIGLGLLPEHPELEAYLPPLVRQIIADEPAVDGRLTLLSHLIVLVGGEIAKGRILAARPPYWRQLAAITQAALIERELVAAGVDQADSRFLEWTRQGRGQYFFLQAMVDLRQEPRWLPDFVSPDQLKSEFLGRLAGAAQKHKANIQSDELRALLLGTEEGGVQSLLRFPFPFLPGPLEGGVEASSEMPEEIKVAVREQLAAEAIKPSSFAALVNSALVFKIHADHPDLAASALRRAKYQIRGGENPGLHFSLLSGLATVAAVTRSEVLANDIRILTRAARRRLGIGTEDAMRIGLIAASAFSDKKEWAKVVGDWMTELAFEDQDDMAAAKLLSHIRVLVLLEPELWRTCTKAEAALASIAR